jgi:hypothetical protein
MSADELNQRRKQQIARNEALFREVNERVQEVSEERATLMTDFVCECGDSGCTETIPLRDAEYEHVRADPLLFVVVPGHEILEVETVIEEHERFNVARKHVAEAALAQDTDPRS